MKVFSTYVFLIIILLISSCKKVDLPDPTFSQPVFYVDWTSNGVSEGLTAGEDNFVLTSDFGMDNNGVHEFIAKFDKIDCVFECGESLVIKIKDFQVAVAGGVNIEEALVPGNYFYEAHPDTIWIVDVATTYTIDFDASSTIFSSGGANPTPIYTWTFPNGNTITSMDPQVQFILQDINIPNEVPVTLLVLGDSTANCFSTATQLIRLNAAGSTQCGVQIMTNSNPIGLLDSLNAIAYGTAPFTYLWSTGESSADIFPQFFGDPYSVTITDATGCVAESMVIAPSPNALDFCSAHFTSNISVDSVVDSTFTIETNPFEFSKIIIEYTDKDSTFYSTELAPQTNVVNSFFKINAVDDFDDNPSGQKTKKLNIQFSCILFSENGDSMELTEGEGVIGVAYPD